MRQFIWLSILLALTISVKAQRNGMVKGQLIDTSVKQPVGSATITLMQKKDSSLVSFTMTDNNGKFEFSNIQNGEYRLLVSHVNYYNVDRLIKIDDDHKSISLENIPLTDRNKVLSEVFVTAEAPPVTLVGDTIQYNAGSFKTQPNANVEDLLKRLPGVKVDKDGNVKAQGEKVKKVLVDGKEFFGDDPKIATKNLPADAVDKVQVFDKLSDQAQLTGFDDGNSEKTINLKLKKERKKGMFGKLNGGGGTDGRYEGRFNVNSFKGARQMSVIGMGNNTNAEGFSFMDALNFSGALSQLKNGGGDININIDDNGSMAGLLGGNNTGINTIFGGGINYNNIIGTKTDFRSNFFYNRFDPARQSIIERQYFSPANLYRETSGSNNLNNNYRLNINADYQIDSFNSLKISPSYSYQKTKNQASSGYSTNSEFGTRINDGNSDNLTNSEGYNFGTSLLYRRKFHRRGRSFSLNLITSLNSTTGSGALHSLTNFYDQAGQLQNQDSIDQRNNNNSSVNGYNIRAVYTEPILKRSILEFSLGKSNTNNAASKTTYDYNQSNGKFDLLNDLLTNDFKNSYDYTNAGLRFRKQAKNYAYSAGFSWQQAGLEGTIVNNAKDSVITKNFTNILPTARFQYYFSKFKNLSINYSTNTNQPTITQLQPVPDNTNPLYIKLGNPDLKQEFMHLVRINASFVSPYKNRNLFAFFTIQQTEHKIVNLDRINKQGVDSVTPENVNGVYAVNGTLSWGFPVHFLKGTIDLSSDLSYGRDKQLLADSLNQVVTNNINTVTAGPTVRLDMSPTDKLNLSLSAGLYYSRSLYSFQTSRSSKYLDQQYSSEIDWQLVKGFYFSTDLVYTIKGQHAQGFNAKVPFWNASLSKQMLHFNRGELKFRVNDILNENVSISRTTNQNYIQDTRVSGLRRFFLLSFTYSLTKTGFVKDDGQGMRIIRK